MNDISAISTILPGIKPQLQPTVLAVPLSERRVALHSGTRQAAANLIVDDPLGWRRVAVGLMNGSRTIEEIASSLDQIGHPVEEAEVGRLIETLVAAGVVADADAFVMDGLRDDEVQRYSRNLNGWSALSTDGRTGADLQKALAHGHVLMLGVGGLGSCAAQALAMAGCGTLTLVDFDTVELGNLNRQLYSTGDIGTLKTEVTKRRLEATNPDVKVATMPIRLTGRDHMRSILDQVEPDIAVVAIDRPTIAADRWVNDACFEKGVPLVCNSVSAGTGMLWTKVPGQTGCFACDELWAKTKMPDHYEIRRYREQNDLIPATSAFSYGAMVIGGMIASDVIRHLVKWPMASAGRLVVLDFKTLTTNVSAKPAHPECPVCAHLPRGECS
jgi:molybdopterin/thiamine biosynthesis adenylyltransferase